MDKRVNRRDLIKSALGTSLLGGMPFSFPAKASPSKPKIVASVKVIFDDGDYQEIFFEKHQDEKLYVIKDRLGHYRSSITTEFEINSMFGQGLKRGIYDYPIDAKPRITYKGFDKRGRLVYTNTGHQKIWKEYP